MVKKDIKKDIQRVYEDDTWLDSYIIINSWKVVLNNEDLN